MPGLLVAAKVAVCAPVVAALLTISVETPGAVVEVAKVEAIAEASATHPVKAPAHMAQAVLTFNEQLERFAEVAMVLVVGAMFSYATVPSSWWWFVPLLLLAIRPVSVLVAGTPAMTSSTQLPLIAWFGIRGIGSIYYLLYAINHGLPDALAAEIAGLTLATVVGSIVLHGISITPLMRRYRGGRDHAKAKAESVAGANPRGRR